MEHYLRVEMPPAEAALMLKLLPVSMNDPDEEPHPPLDKLKAKCSGEAVLVSSGGARQPTTN